MKADFPYLSPIKSIYLPNLNLLIPKRIVVFAKEYYKKTHFSSKQLLKYSRLTFPHFLLTRATILFHKGHLQNFVTKVKRSVTFLQWFSSDFSANCHWQLFQAGKAPSNQLCLVCQIKTDQPSDRPTNRVY